MPLLIHGEVTTPGVDIFDKEATFVEEVIKVRCIYPSIVFDVQSNDDRVLFSSDYFAWCNFPLSLRQRCLCRRTIEMTRVSLKDA